MAKLKKVNAIDTQETVLPVSENKESTIPVLAGTDLGKLAIANIVEAVKNLPVLKEEDVHFLQTHKESLAMVLEKTYMWRTDGQKRSIVSDFNHPTVHSKLHQAILEQKVQFDQAMYLAKDFELKKLEIEELECDLEELEDTKRSQIKGRKIALELQFKQYELKNAQIAMDYRMREVKGWEKIKEECITYMRREGVPDEQIWNKEAGELAALFFQALTNLEGIRNSTDGGEVNNLLALARFAVQQVKQAKMFDAFLPNCNSIQINSLRILKEIDTEGSSVAAAFSKNVSIDAAKEYILAGRVEFFK